MSSNHLTIILHPSSTPGKSSASLLNQDNTLTPLVSAKRTPFLSAARVLIGMGYAPDLTLTMRREGSPIVALTAKLGVAAKLTVKEPDNGPMRFAPYEAYPRAQKAVSRCPVAA